MAVRRDTGGIRGRLDEAWRFLDHRLGLGGLRYPVPQHANSVWYTLGGLTFLLFGVLVATGIYLAQFYEPTTRASGHASVRHIDDVVFLGEFARGLHYWAAAIFAGLVVAHLVRTFVTASFKPPREFTWLSGLLLAALAGAALFTGTALKGDQQAVDAAARRTDFVDLFGALGFWFSADFTESVEPITRIHIAHVTVLPMLMVALIAGHLLLIKRHGISPMPTGDPLAIERRRRLTGVVQFTSHQQHMFRLGIPLVAALVVLSVAAPPGLGALGDPALEPRTKPPWSFLWLYQVDEAVDRTLVVIVLVALVLLLMALPFADRSEERDPRRRPFSMALGAVLVLGWLGLTVAGAVG